MPAGPTAREAPEDGVKSHCSWGGWGRRDGENPGTGATVMDGGGRHARGDISCGGSGGSSDYHGSVIRPPFVDIRTSSLRSLHRRLATAERWSCSSCWSSSVSLSVRRGVISPAPCRPQGEHEREAASLSETVSTGSCPGAAAAAARAAAAAAADVVPATFSTEMAEGSLGDLRGAEGAFEGGGAEDGTSGGAAARQWISGQ